jgi:uncharacterized protein (TIGR02266 family)
VVIARTVGIQGSSVHLSQASRWRRRRRLRVVAALIYDSGCMSSKLETNAAEAIPYDESAEADQEAERRHELRIAGRLEVRFSMPAQAARALRAYSLNFSLGGLCLRPHRPYPVGTELQLCLQIQSESLELFGVVAWVRNGAIGVRFVQLSPHAKERLGQLIEHVAG